MSKLSVNILNVIIILSKLAVLRTLQGFLTLEQKSVVCVLDWPLTYYQTKKNEKFEKVTFYLYNRFRENCLL